MPNILTAAEAATFVRTDVADSVMLGLLPMVDEFIEQSTGHDWTADNPIDPAAKLAAGALLVSWYDNPALQGTVDPAGGLLSTLEAKAFKWRKYVFAGRNGAGSIYLEHARKGDVVITLTGTYGVSGSQVASFAANVSDDQQLEQTSGSDLSENLYVVVLKNPEDDVSA